MNDPAVEAIKQDQKDEDETFAGLIVQISEQYDQDCEARHKMGAEKYGPGKFLTVDTLQEAIDEVVDLGNYARYTYIKLMLLQASLTEMLPEQVERSDFIKAKDFTKPGEA